MWHFWIGWLMDCMEEKHDEMDAFYIWLSVQPFDGRRRYKG